MTDNHTPLRALIVTAHPDPHSVTMSTARAVAAGLRDAGLDSVEHHDLVAARFDADFHDTDLALYRDPAAPLPDDVLAEQRRLEEVDVLAVVFPVYWWSLPGVLKGWIDRVFTRGWAYDDTGAGLLLRSPKRMYFIGIGATNEATYRKRGYLESMRTQLVDGIAGYMGADDADLVLLHDGESSDPAVHRARDEAARAAAYGLGLRGRETHAA